jgi:hypothetical protein
MSTPKFKIEDIRFSSSSIDDFLTGRLEKVAVASAARSRVASQKVRIANLNQLAGFQLIADDTLVRLSQKDFWKLGQDEQGPFIERLVEDSTGPVKE